MVSKEKTFLRLENQEKINADEMQKYGRISLINKLETKYLKEVLKDLEDYEELKKIMGTPIQDIMKRLKILEEIREYIKVIDYGEEYQNRYALQVGDVIYPIKKDVYDRWSRWLGNDK